MNDEVILGGRSTVRRRKGIHTLIDYPNKDQEGHSFLLLDRAESYMDLTELLYQAGFSYEAEEHMHEARKCLPKNPIWLWHPELVRKYEQEYQQPVTRYNELASRMNQTSGIEIELLEID